jgi:hypothetical protein
VEEADVLLWRPALSTLFLGGVVNNHYAALCRHGRSWSPPGRGSVDGTLSSVLIFLLSTETYRINVDVVHPLTRNSSRGGLLVLGSFSRHSPREVPPHEGLLHWAPVVGLPLGRSWAIEGAPEQVDRDTPVSRTLTTRISSTSSFFLRKGYR